MYPLRPDFPSSTDVPVLRALYVEDNAQDADLTCRALARADLPISVDVVSSLSDARARLDRAPGLYQWVLFDLSLPDGDGLQVLRHLRMKQVDTVAITVTGTGDEKAVAQALKMGVDDYVIKRGDYLDTLAAVLHDARRRHLMQAREHARTIRVLHIEDNSLDAELTRHHLAVHAPHLLLETLHAPSAERLASSDYDVLLLDYLLDDLDAFELVRQVRRGPRAGVPIVLITGSGEEETAVRALRLGVSDYVIKDVNHLLRLPAVLESAFSRAELTREQERLRASEAQLLRLTRQVPGSFVIMRWLDHDNWHTEFASDGLERVFGVKAGELDNGVGAQRLHPEDKGRLVEAMARAAQTGATVDCAYRFDCPPRGWRWLETQMTPERQADGGLRLYCYTFDITERKQFNELTLTAEAAQQANQAKTEFLSRMSHELRTPLNAVLGFAQLLQADTHERLSDQQRSQVRFIEQAGNHLVDLISEVLDLSRIEAGQMNLSPAPVDGRAICQEVLTMLGTLASRHGVTLQLEAPAQPDPHCVMADRLRLRQILVNLVSNAIKYNRPQGRVDLQVREQGDAIVFDVRDTGQGLTTEQLAHLYEPFNRLGAERSEIEGSGIGLVIVHKLVTLMGGHLSVDSRPGEGSHFSFQLPRAAAERSCPAASDVAEAPAAPAPARTSNARTVLYVEDNPVNVILMEQIFTMRPEWTLRVAPSGRQALDMAQAFTPDLLLLDMNLGDMDGHAVAESLRQMPGRQGLAIVALSADAPAQHAAQSDRNGYADYLMKPLDVPQLLACLDRHLA
jgi:signal transduction histidine kinase